MKIAIIHNKYKLAGGMERYLFDLIRGFTAAGDEVSVFVVKQSRKAPRFQHCSIISSKLNWLPRRWRKYIFLRHCNKKFNRDDFDLVLSLTGTHAADIAVCGWVHASFVKHKKQLRWFDRADLKYEKSTFEKTPLIMSHSPLLQDEITRYYPAVPQNKIINLYPPIDNARLHFGLRENRAQWQKKYGIDSCKTTLLFPSMGHERKGLYELLDAMRMLPEDEFELLILGPKPRVNIPANTRFLGYIEKIEELYVAADYMILPSHYEPFGMVVSESLACGTPVIISRHVGAKGLVNDNNGVIMKAVEPSLIANQLLALRTKPHAVSATFVEDHGLSLDKHIEKIKKLFKSDPASTR